MKPSQSEAEQKVPCGICGAMTRMFATRRCDRCWELEGRIHGDPDLAEKIMASLRSATAPLPANARAVAEELTRLREIEHLAWHILDDSEENATTGEVTITPMREDYDKLVELLPEGHPERDAALPEASQPARRGILDPSVYDETDQHRTTATQRNIDIVFDGPPGPESGRLVEVESPPGKSISFGQWVQREDGYWVLRFVQSEKPAIPEGWKLVPVEPTTAMMLRGTGAFLSIGTSTARAIYRNMLAAAPSPDGNDNETGGAR